MGGSAYNKEKRKVSLETALKSLKTLLDIGDDKFFIAILDIDIHLSQNLFLCSLYVFKTLKSSTHDLSLLPSAKGLSFTFMLSQFSYFFLSQKQTLVSPLCATIFTC